MLRQSQRSFGSICASACEYALSAASYLPSRCSANPPRMSHHQPPTLHSFAAASALSRRPASARYRTRCSTAHRSDGAWIAAESSMEMSASRARLIDSGSGGGGGPFSSYQ